MKDQKQYASALLMLTCLVLLPACRDWSKDQLLDLPPATFGEPKQEADGQWSIGLTWQVKSAGLENPRWCDTVVVSLNQTPIDTLILRDSSSRHSAHALQHSVNARILFRSAQLAAGINQFAAAIRSIERGGNRIWPHPVLLADKRCGYGWGQLIGLNWLVPVAGVLAGALMLAWLIIAPTARWSFRRVLRKSGPWLPLDQCTVLVTAGMRCGETIRLPELLHGHAMTLGSAVADSVRFSDDPFMAGQHAALLPDGHKRRVYIRPAGPERPVYVNGRLLAADQSVWLKNGDLLSLGGVTLVFQERRAIRLSV